MQKTLSVEYLYNLYRNTNRKLNALTISKNNASISLYNYVNFRMMIKFTNFSTYLYFYNGEEEEIINIGTSLRHHIFLNINEIYEYVQHSIKKLFKR